MCSLHNTCALSSLWLCSCPSLCLHCSPSTDYPPLLICLRMSILPSSPWKTVLPLRSFLDFSGHTFYVPIQLNEHFCSVCHSTLHYLMDESVWIRHWFLLYQSEELAIPPRALCWEGFWGHIWVQQNVKCGLHKGKDLIGHFHPQISSVWLNLSTQ